MISSIPVWQLARRGHVPAQFTMDRFANSILALILASCGCSGAQIPQLVDEFTLGPKHPAASLILAGDGNMYGTSVEGGTYGFGTIYRVLANEQVEVVGSFTGNVGALPGANASSQLTVAPDGNLYGVTVGGGADGVGTVFKVTPGSGAVHLASFTGYTGARPGFGPVGSLAVGADGNLYGTTRQGGPSQAGTVFMVTLPGGTVVHRASFTGGPRSGYYPASTLTLAPDGFLYGGISSSDSEGKIFKVAQGGGGDSGCEFYRQLRSSSGIWRILAAIHRRFGR